AQRRLPYGLRRDSEWSQQREKMGPLSRRCRLFDLDPDLLPLFQYNCKQFASPQECLASPEFLDHIRKNTIQVCRPVSSCEIDLVTGSNS
uniref:Uncharacterized protein n=1 Tax=Meleagris gallopavo TaxID=9103 RepID=A0A803Y8Q5_MELGA